MENLRVFFFAINLFLLTVYANNSTEKQLLSDIFQNYDERARPLLNNSAPVKVKITFLLLTVHDLDMRNQELSSSADVSISWTDEFLKWNKNSYGGLGLIRVPQSNVWKPDVVLTNSVNRKDIFEKNGENVIIYNDGTVLWHSYKKLKTFVHVDTTFYPFDVQDFYFNFSKLYFDDTYQQNYFNSEDNVIGNFVSNGEWDFNHQRSPPMRRCLETHDRNGKRSSKIIWQFTLDRRQTYYIWSFLVPIAALSFVSVLTFLLPVKNSEKLTLAVFSFISIAVVIRLFNQTLPSTSDKICKFGMLLSITLAIVGFVIIINVLISCCYHRKFFKLCRDKQPESKDKPESTVQKDDSTSDSKSTKDKSSAIPPTPSTPTTPVPEDIKSSKEDSLEQSITEDITCIKETVEKEVKRQKEEKEIRRNRSNRASKCDICCGISIFVAFICVYLGVLQKFVFGDDNLL